MGGWILDRQNDVWHGPYGDGARWRDPWSAAFISWVMCEGGLGEDDLFRRHIAHYVYIDQRSKRATAMTRIPLTSRTTSARCRSSRASCCAPRGARRITPSGSGAADLGEGVRTHCDITIRVEEQNGRVLLIGGNVSGSVRMKLFAAEFDANGDGKSTVRWVGGDGRTIFAHLKLRADPIGADALETSPTVKALVESGDDSAGSGNGSRASRRCGPSGRVVGGHAGRTDARPLSIPVVVAYGRWVA